MLCYKERHPLLLECFVTSLGFITMIGEVAESIYKASHVLHRVISVKIESQMHTKYQILDTLSEWELVYCAIRRGIHC